MKLYEVQDRSQPLLAALLEIWEQSVRATHLFLSDAEVKAIRAYVPKALKSVEHLIVAETEQPIAFMGVQDGRIGDAVSRAGGTGERHWKADAPIWH